MKIIIKTKNLELTPSLENLINKRMTGLSKMINEFQESANLLVEIEKVTKHHRKGDIFSAQALVNLPGKKLVAKAHGENMGLAITEIRDELVIEIKKHKTKVIDMPRRKAMKKSIEY